jgi:hypothetical protein
MRKIFLLLLPGLLLLTLFRVAPLSAQTAVLLPIADTAVTYNGVDLDTTATFNQLLVDAGLKLIDDRPMRKFMAANYMRRSGAIDSFTAKMIGRELGADFVILATVCEDGFKERFGLVLTVLETVNGTVVWSLQKSSSLYQETTLLGIGAPFDGGSLRFQMLVEAARRTAAKVQSLDPGKPMAAHPLKLVDLQVYPQYVQGKSRVECRLRLQSLTCLPDRVELTSNGQIIKLIPGEIAGDYSGHWQAPSADGEYGVKLKFFNYRDGTTVTMADYAGYQVINQAPKLTFVLKQGVAFNQVTVFREQLLIASKLNPRRPVSRWQVEVTQLDGTVVVNDQMDGELPRSLFWRGHNNQHQRLPDGEYIFSLVIWDAAGNRAEATQRVALRSQCQPVEVGIIPKGKKNFIRLSTQKQADYVLALDWKLRVFLPGGKLLLKESGTNLPVEIELPADLKTDYLLYSIDVRDQIDNTFAVADIRLLLPNAAPEAAAGEKWSDDF